MDLSPKDASSPFVHNQADQPVTTEVMNNQTSRDYSSKSKRPRLSEVQRREKKRQTGTLYRQLKRMRSAALTDEIKCLKMINHQLTDANIRLKEALEQLQPNFQLLDQNLKGLESPLIQVQYNKDCGAVDCVHSQADQPVTTGVMNNQTSHEDAGKSKRHCRSDIQSTEKKNHAMMSRQQREHRKEQQVKYAQLMEENNYLKIKIHNLTNEINELKESSKRPQSNLLFPDQNLKRLESPLIQVQCNKDSGAVDWFGGFEMNQNIEDLQKVSVNEGVAINEHLTKNNEMSLAGTCYDSSNITELLLKIDADDKSRVTFSDFVGLLDGDYRVVGSYSFPLSLHPTLQRINSVYGDISATCKMNARAVRTTYILFCATIKEMDDLKLEQVTEKKLLKWRDAIKDALRIDFRVEFAMEQLKKIARACIGLVLRQELNLMTVRSSKLEADLNAYREVHAKLIEQFKLYKDSVEEFSFKSVSTGLFP